MVQVRRWGYGDGGAVSKRSTDPAMASPIQQGHLSADCHQPLGNALALVSIMHII